MFWFSSVWSSSAVSAHTFWDIDPLSHRCHGYSTCWSSFPKTSYTQSSRPQPLAPPQHTSGSALITRNVPTLCVHSSPSSPCASHTFHEFSSNPPQSWRMFALFSCKWNAQYLWETGWRLVDWTFREVSSKLRPPPYADLMADRPTYSELLN